MLKDEIEILLSSCSRRTSSEVDEEVKSTSLLVSVTSALMLSAVSIGSFIHGGKVEV